MTNEQIFEFEYNKAKNILNKSLENKNIEKALSSLSAISFLCYEWNQFYVDKYIEESLLELSKLIESNFDFYTCNEEIILFYDGFGQDTRGLSLIYMKALAKKFKVVYVTHARYRDAQPTLYKELENFNVKFEYLDRNDSNYGNIRQLCNIFNKYKFSSAFLYSMPNDIAGILTFTIFRNNKNLNRYKINLTDHAFWMGLNSFNYIIEFRDYGAVVSRDYRDIPQNKIIKLPYYPYVDSQTPFLGFPFEINDNPIIFSGGSLYKTIDDSKKYYYIVNELLKRNDKCIFLYAGSGDSTELDKLKIKFSSRVFHINERKDLFQLMKHITLYLNTYPMVGGLMMQYAVLAGKIPLTLKHNSDGDGILLNQKTIGIEYTNSNKLIEDATLLLKDENYRKKREARVSGAVPTCEEFEQTLLNIVKFNNTKYKIDYYDLDTKEFIRAYVQRFNINNYIHAIAKKRNKTLILNYPIYFIYEYIKTVKRRLEEGRGCK